jgi:DNA-binding response OmpR family regulator
MKILVADDEAVSRLLVRRTLEALGHEVLEVPDGREAWQLIQADRPQILIVDWMMPHVDGLELCRMVRSENRARYTYIIMLTALGGKGSYLEGMNAGADDFMTKPFDQDQLRARLRVAERILNLQAEVKQLEGLLPICSYCRRIRDDQSQWQSMEQYISQRTDAAFSHGICPACYEVHVQPELQAFKVSQL